MGVFFETDEIELEIDEEENLLELCLNNKIELSHSCDGMASCGTCRVIITEGVDQLPERNSLESDMAEDRGFAKEERLACQLELETEFSFIRPGE
jgi:2Fe-2S ferredoxin